MRNLEKINADLKKENECLTKRLKHLLESQYIRKFDKKRHGEYVRNIEDADAENPIIYENEEFQKVQNFIESRFNKTM